MIRAWQSSIMRPIRTRSQPSRPARIATIVITAAIFALTSGFGGSARAANSDRVVATVGSHRISQQEMDAKLMQIISPTQLAKFMKSISPTQRPRQFYNLRQIALDMVINEYLLEQAATRAHLTPDQYLKRQAHSTKITEADAREFYNGNKARFGTTTFDQIKQRLIQGLRQFEAIRQTHLVIANLRARQNIKIALQAPCVAVVK